MLWDFPKFLVRVWASSLLVLRKKEISPAFGRRRGREIRERKIKAEGGGNLDKEEEG